LQLRDLLTLARRIGADVPFFFTGGRAIGVGRGDEVYPLEDVRAEDILLVNCGVRVPTSEAYGMLEGRLTRSEGDDIIPFSLEAAYAGIGRSRTVRPELRNDLEAAVFSRYPLLSEVKKRLMSSRAQAVAMSGSGSTVFALFESRTALVAAREEIERSGWWCAHVRALGRTEYFEKLGALERADID
jgi:4-diphosphocytidyl-2-C-methyl-D-erythritol kinase